MSQFTKLINYTNFTKTLNAKDLQMIQLVINGMQHNVDVSPDMPILWVIRDFIELTGTKYGCGLGVCGSWSYREHPSRSPVRSLGPQRAQSIQRCAHSAQHDPLYHRLHQFHAGASVMLMLRGALTLQKPKLISATLCAPARASVNIPPRRTAHATCKALGAARSPPLASPLKDVVPLAAAVV